MTRIVSFVQNLSLDVVAGAVISSLFIASLFGVHLSINVCLGLSIAIWLIYTLDHLWDAQRVEGAAVNPRHAFHQRHKKRIIVLTAVIFIIGLFNTLYLPLRTIKLGIVLILLSGLYFLYLKWSKSDRAKEPFAALVYSAGIFAGPASLIYDWSLMHAAIFIQFFLLAYANLMLFPLYEKELDGKENMQSIVLRKGDKKTKRFIKLVLISSLLLSLPIYFTLNRNSALVFVLMALVLFVLLLKPAFFKNHKFYRILGDGIFFLPGLLLL